MKPKITKLPSSIRVGAYDVTITQMHPDWFREDGEIKRWGDFTSSTQTINLRSDWPNGYVAIDTLIHELMHAIWYQSGLGEEAPEENVCAALSTGLTQVFRDAPELIDYVQEKLKRR